MRPLPLPLLLLLLATAAAAQTALPDLAVLETTLGKKALVIAEEQVAHFYAWRRDITPTWQGRPVEVFEGISLRASFQKHGDECVVAGQFALLGDEVVPALCALASGALRIASLVPRFPGAEPEVFELRFFGEGKEEELARAVAAGFRAVPTPSANSAQPSVPGAAQAVPAAARRNPAAASAPGPSTITERPLEDRLGRKAEVKEGVALFRFEGQRGLLGGTPTSRMGVSVHASFAGSDEAARVRLDWTVDRRDLVRLLQGLAAQGFRVESLVAAAPALDDELLQVVMVGSGRAVALADALAAGLEHTKKPNVLVGELPFTAPAGGRELLGLADGKLAQGWRSGATHPEGNLRATWVVGGQAKIASMTEPGNWSSRTFNLLWLPDAGFRDGVLTVRMRADQGRVDQGGGLIWRAKDERNYFVTRFNPLEQDFRVYHVVDGVRTQIQALGQLPYRSQDWFTIEVTARGDEIRCVLNGRETLSVRDAHFPDAGGVGIWSKADSQCSVAGLWLVPSPQ
jgi:hypothetical protein